MSKNIALIAYLVVCVTRNISCGSLSIPPCKLEDHPCVTASTKAALSQFISGDPSRGIEPLDPMHLDLISADVANLKYNFSDVTCLGYKDCDLRTVKLDLEKLTLHIETTCALEMYGSYEIHGRLLILPVEGDGKFKISALKMLIVLDAEVKLIDGEDGKSHLNIKKFKLNFDALDKVTFDFKNLFNGNEQIAQGFLKFANENYREVSNEVGAPIFNATFKKLMKNINKYLKYVPFSDLVLQ